MEKIQFFNELKRYLIERNLTNVTEIEEDSDLIRTGIVDSFSLTELILFIEDLTGHEIPVDDFEVDSIRSFNAIYNTFFCNHRE
ncbi:D-alanine--poly(phosphoribitol) ligase subunit 2 [compost metagenome]